MLMRTFGMAALCFGMTCAAHGQAANAPLTLTGAVSAAMAANPATRAAAASLAQAQARLGQAQAGRRFAITFSSVGGVSDAKGGALNTPPDRQTFGALQNALSVPIPIGPRPRLAVTAAQAQFAAAQAQAEAARRTLAGQVVAAFFAVRRQEALRDAARETLTQAQRQQDEAQKRNRAGDASDLDVLRTQTPVAAAQSSLSGAEVAVSVARQALRGALGQSLDGPLSLADFPLPPADPALTLDTARTRALAFSADIQAADALVRTAELAVQNAKAWRAPSVALTLSDVRSGDKTGFARLDSLEASVSVPLSDGGLARAQIREAEASLDAARAQAQGARQAVLVSVSGAFLSAEGARRQLDSARMTRALAQTAYDKTLRGYRAGLFPLTDALNAQAALTQARTALAQAVTDAAESNVALRYLVGDLRP